MNYDNNIFKHKEHGYTILQGYRCGSTEDQGRILKGQGRGDPHRVRQGEEEPTQEGSSFGVLLGYIQQA